MTQYKARTFLRPTVRLVSQLCLFAGFYYLLNYIVIYFHIPLPTNVFGFFILLFLLSFRLLPLTAVKAGANFLIAEILLFFIPLVIGIIPYKNVLMHNGIKLIGAVIIGTVFVMLITAITVEVSLKLENKLKKKVLIS